MIRYSINICLPILLLYSNPCAPDDLCKNANLEKEVNSKSQLYNYSSQTNIRCFLYTTKRIIDSDLTNITADENISSAISKTDENLIQEIKGLISSATIFSAFLLEPQNAQSLDSRCDFFSLSVDLSGIKDAILELKDTHIKSSQERCVMETRRLNRYLFSAKKTLDDCFSKEAIEDRRRH